MIIGAGLAGTIAAFVFQKMPVFEARDRSWVEHQAVLRFRSSVVADLTGIPFRRVMVRKGIWDGRDWTEPTISACNAYAQKTIGRLADRSIWDIRAVERWVAPPDLRERMCSVLGDRISWNSPVDLSSLGAEPVISTIPMTALAGLVKGEGVEFRFAPIATTTLELPGADVFQTVYFTSRAHSLYRASITGDKLICEWATDSPTDADVMLAASELARAFSLDGAGYERLLEATNTPHVQQFGKIAPIDEFKRRDIVLRLTTEHNIYSLGRFATWRNILLDDVVHDAAVIKRLLTASDDYDRALGRRIANV